MRFLRDNPSWEKPLGRERNHYCQEVTVNFTELYYGYNLLNHIPFFVREGLFILNCWPRGKCNDGEIGITAVIFTREIVITAAIVGA